MNNINNPLNTTQITINGLRQTVYINQSVLQAILQIDENVQHNCHVASNYHKYRRACDCVVKIEIHDGNLDFKACLAPVKSGMVITT